jgi:small-conductance mechanosensitive channel
LGLFAFKYHTDNIYVNYTHLQNKIRLILRYICCLTPVIAVIGYTELSAFIALNILGSIIAVIFFIFSRKMIVTVSQFLKQKSHFIGVNQNDDEISPLAVIIFEPVIALLSAGIILFFWGVTSQDFNLWLEEYKNGITIGQMTLNFKNLFSAVISLFLIIGLTKIIQWFLGRRVFKHTSLDIGLQNTIITIIGYGGIIMAFLSASGTLGIDMANFAIVAGALSVGIGFGLQTIFNNFISGLILLFERPFKVGDLVRVGMNEGIIKKIKVRSTELETGANQSLIVPNSMMISDTVSNWTLHNKTGRCEIRLGVAYNSDTELVKKVLLESVEHHTDILSSPPPMVLFIDFAESSLNFELRFFIIDIGEKTRISSEVRFKIDALFRTHNISLPFPQRDIHIHTKDDIKNI